jgi:hypothetical protein
MGLEEDEMNIQHRVFYMMAIFIAAILLAACRAGEDILADEDDAGGGGPGEVQVSAVEENDEAAADPSTVDIKPLSAEECDALVAVVQSGFEHPIWTGYTTIGSGEELCSVCQGDYVADGLDYVDATEIEDRMRGVLTGDGYVIANEKSCEHFAVVRNPAISTCFSKEALRCLFELQVGPADEELCPDGELVEACIETLDAEQVEYRITLACDRSPH